ncbi:MAG: GNAT family N-acetyltransferase [Chloroflexi bacterium]|nr:GNAT family N-acetyltransferase [Chloroflexota bacterium]
MTYQAFSHKERPELGSSWDEVVGPAWPKFMYEDAVCNRFWSGLTRRFPSFQIYLVEQDSGRVVGHANSIPFAWSGATADLPDGVNGVLPLAFEQLEQGLAPNTLCALQAVVLPSAQGQGLSTIIIKAMRDAGARHGLADLVAPVRPNQKHLYPLMPMESYASWTRADGMPFDPWMRVHARLGGQIMGICQGSNVVQGTIAEWQEWTGLTFPVSGEYVVQGALVPVSISVEHDLGRIAEPNVWMRHRLGDAR